MQVRKRIKDPIVGFGWAGYLGAAILLALFTVLISGVELRYQFLKLILHTLGVDAMMYFVSRLAFFGFSIFGMSVSLVTGLGVLVAFCVSPYRFRSGVKWLIFILCAAWFVVPLMAMGAWYQAGWGGAYKIFQILDVFGVVLVGGILFSLSRSKFVVLMWILAGLLVAANAVWYQIKMDYLPGTILLFYAFDFYEFTSYSLIFQLTTVGSIVYWAVVERRKAVPERGCPACGYDLVGLGGDAPCPECGERGNATEPV